MHSLPHWWKKTGGPKTLQHTHTHGRAKHRGKSQQHGNAQIHETKGDSRKEGGGGVEVARKEGRKNRKQIKERRKSLTNTPQPSFKEENESLPISIRTRDGQQSENWFGLPFHVTLCKQVTLSRDVTDNDDYTTCSRNGSEKKKNKIKKIQEIRHAEWKSGKGIGKWGLGEKVDEGWRDKLAAPAPTPTHPRPVDACERARATVSVCTRVDALKHWNVNDCNLD